MALFGGLFGSGNKTLLVAEIYMIPTSPVSCRAAVSLTPKLAQISPSEFVRICLHHYAKAMFLLEPGDTIALDGYIEWITDDEITNTTNIIELCGLHDYIEALPGHQVRNANVYRTKLIHVDVKTRHVITEIPRIATPEQLTYSVVLLIDAALKRLEGHMAGALQRSLVKMHSEYRNYADYRSLRELARIPNHSYIQAVMEG